MSKKIDLSDCPNEEEKNRNGNSSTFSHSSPPTDNYEFYQTPPSQTQNFSYNYNNSQAGTIKYQTTRNNINFPSNNNPSDIYPGNSSNYWESGNVNNNNNNNSNTINNDSGVSGLVSSYNGEPMKFDDYRREEPRELDINSLQLPPPNLDCYVEPSVPRNTIIYKKHEEPIVTRSITLNFNTVKTVVRENVIHHQHNKTVITNVMRNHWHTQRVLVKDNNYHHYLINNVVRINDIHHQKIEKVRGEGKSVNDFKQTQRIESANCEFPDKDKDSSSPSSSSNSNQLVAQQFQQSQPQQQTNSYQTVYENGSNNEDNDDNMSLDDIITEEEKNQEKAYNSNNNSKKRPQRQSPNKRNNRNNRR